MKRYAEPEHQKIHFHDVDILRGALMALGVILHAAVYLSPGTASPRIQLGLSAELYGFLVQVIHYFRMPAFFLIAGFFTTMLLERYSASTVMQRRAVRLLVPTLACGLTFNILLGYLSWPQNSQSFVSPAYWLSGQWLSHLWFLPQLYLYTIILAVLPAISKWRPSQEAPPAIVVLLGIYILYPSASFLAMRIGWAANQ